MKPNANSVNDVNNWGHISHESKKRKICFLVNLNNKTGAHTYIINITIMMYNQSTLCQLINMKSDEETANRN